MTLTGLNSLRSSSGATRRDNLRSLGRIVTHDNDRGSGRILPLPRSISAAGGI
jgi:hypothetical protein